MIEPPPGSARSTSTHHDARWLGVVALGYALSLGIGLRFLVLADAIAILWPASGVLVAALALAPQRLRGAVLAVGFAVNIVAHLAHGAALPAGIAISVANVAESALVNWLVGRAGGLTEPGSVRRFLARVGLVFVGTAAAGPLAAAAQNDAYGAPFWATWQAWTLTNGVSILVVAPAIMALAHVSPHEIAPHARRIGEAAVFAALVVVTATAVFATNTVSASVFVLLPYMVFPYLIWATVRFGQAGGSAAVLITAVIVLWQTVHRHGPFMLLEASIGRGVLAAQAFLGISAVSVLVLGAILDERQRTEAALRQSEERLRDSLARLQLVLERMPIGCIINDAEFRVSYWNPAAERIFGFSAAEVLGNAPERFLVPHSSLPNIEALHTAIRAGEQRSGTAPTLTKTGRVITCEWQHTPLFDSTGAFVGSLAMAQDVTERAAAEQEIRRLNDDLERRVAARTAALEAANRELEAFSYSVSHDLRAPLRHIDGFVSLLSRRVGASLDATARHYLEVIADSSRHMGQLIDDLLTLSHVGRSELQVQPVALAELLPAVCAELAPAVAGRAITWQIGPLPTVLADPRLMRQVLVNLLSNAIKYTGRRQDARIALGTLDASDSHATFFVRDNGAGFDMQYTHKLFGVFQRLHHDDEFEGSGIGLAIVNRIVQRHGGSIRAEGQPDTGAAFFVTLPRAPEEVHP